MKCSPRKRESCGFMYANSDCWKFIISLLKSLADFRDDFTRAFILTFPSEKIRIQDCFKSFLKNSRQRGKEIFVSSLFLIFYWRWFWVSSALKVSKSYELVGKGIFMLNYNFGSTFKILTGDLIFFSQDIDLSHFILAFLNIILWIYYSNYWNSLS